MKRKIAVPVNETGVLDSHFGHCQYFSIHTADGCQVVTEEIVTPPPHEPGILPQWLSDLGVTDVLAGGIGQRAIQIFNHWNIRVFSGAPAIAARELVDGFLNDAVHFTGNSCDH